MKMKMPTSFDQRSLAIFTTLALSAGLASAQFTVGPAAPSKATSAAVAAPVAPAAPSAFQKADTDGNASISRAEARKAGGSVDKWFEQMDSNRDGVLSAAEFKLTRK